MNSAGRVLIARLDTLGLALPVESLLEVRAGLPESGEGECGPAGDGTIPRLDLWRRFGLMARAPATAGILVRTGNGPCLLPVTRVEGLRSSAAGVLCEVPPLLSPRIGDSYQRVLLLEGEPLIWCEPDLWLGGDRRC